jgi:hypothetical protein
MEQTINDARKALGDALIVGGVAVGYYGWKRVTLDVDILYAATDGKILSHLRKDFKLVIKAKSGWHELQHRKTKVRLKLIPEGGLGTNGFIPSPKTAGGNEGIISLLGLAWMKLVAGRSKDLTDLVEIGKTRLPEMKALALRLPAELQPHFSEVLAQAQKELAYDPHNNKDHGIPGVKESPAPYGKKRKTKHRATTAR